MSKWIDLETDASTGKPYLWKCDECGEVVETKWNYCPECGDSKTSKGKSINTLVKALEPEHRKLREIQSATDKNVGTTDTISRQVAIEALGEQPLAWEQGEYEEGLQTQWESDVEAIKNLPPAQPEPCEDAVSRAEVLRMINCINDHHAITPYKSVGAVTEHLKRIASNLPPVTPKQRTGKWILDRSGAYCCSECLEPCAGYVMMKPRDKFCKMCGAKMEGVAE